MGRSLAALYSVDLGVSHQGLTSYGVTFPAGSYPAPVELSTAVDRVLSEFDALGLEATATSHLPLSGARLTSSVLLEGGEAEMSTNGPAGAIKVVAPGYFETLGVPVVVPVATALSAGSSVVQVTVANVASGTIWMSLKINTPPSPWTIARTCLSPAAARYRGMSAWM